MRRDKRGFTVAEVIIAMAITGVVALGAFGLIRAGLAAFDAENGVYGAQSASGAAIAAITRAARSDPGFSPARYTLTDDSLYDGGRFIAGPIAGFSIDIDGALVRVSVTSEGGETVTAAARVAVGEAGVP